MLPHVYVSFVTYILLLIESIFKLFKNKYKLFVFTTIQNQGYDIN